IQPSTDGAPAETTPASTGQLAGFSGHLFRNNMSATLVAFALGITLGIGTAWVLWYNGIIMGALGAVFVDAGRWQEFCTAILPHGVLEIPAILVGGAAGFLLAGAEICGRPWPRREELGRAAREGVLLVAGCLPLLAVAAVLEAVVARAPEQYLD